MDRYRTPGAVRPAAPRQEEPEPPAPVIDEDDEAGFYAWIGQKQYEAFRKRSRPVRHMHICPNGPFWHSGPYRYFLHLAQDGSHGTMLMLVYSFMVVTIRGKRLHTIAASILQEHCHAIRAFNPQEDERPTDESAPFIESIKIDFDNKLAETMKKETESR